MGQPQPPDPAVEVYLLRRSTLEWRAKERLQRIRDGEGVFRTSFRRRRTAGRARAARGDLVDAMTEPGRIDWDLWRGLYDRLDWEDQKRFYARVAALLPDQAIAAHRLADEFFTLLAVEGHSPSVLELGGWDGALAAAMLAAHPALPSWLNLEVAEPPLHDPACHDPRYSAAIPVDFAWRLPAETFEGREALVASHVLEHLRFREIGQLLERMPDLRWCFVEAPIRERDRARGWYAYQGSHILEVGWIRLEEFFARFGFRLRPPISQGVRCFDRSSGP
jgi:hypothetical protein